MSIGPVEYIAIAFPGSKFSGEIVPAIKELQDTGPSGPRPDGHQQGRRRHRDRGRAGRDESRGAAALAVLGVEGKYLLGRRTSRRSATPSIRARPPG